MPAFPLPLFVRNHPADAHTVQNWWDALPEAERAELMILWDRRGNECRFTHAPDGDEAPAGHRLPIIEAEFTDDHQPGDDWRPEWFDHLFSNPDEWVRWEPVFRTFHIGCTAHSAARAVLRAGFIPADFVCPFDSQDCPMRKLLDREPGRSVRLVWQGPHTEGAGRRAGP